MASDLIGQALGQYEVTALLGTGGMATVYRARQLSMDRDVAIKVIKPELAASLNEAKRQEFLKRFEREARVIASLSHAHILKVFDYGKREDLVYLVMELLSGGSLAGLIGQGALPLARVADLIKQISGALDYAHRNGIIHRDLKPQNVLLDNDGNAFLTDFGIAKLLSSTSALTQGGSAMGTPAYMAPEQWRGETVDGRADVYSLGVILFEMLSGALPFESDTPFRMMHMHIYEPPRSIYGLMADIPRGVDKIIEKALAKAPEDRFSSAGQLAAAFFETMGGSISSWKRPESSTVLASDSKPMSDADIRLTLVPIAESNNLILDTAKTKTEDRPTLGKAPQTSPVPIPETAPNRSGLILVGVVALLLIAAAILILPRLNQNNTPSVAAQPSATATATSTLTATATQTATSTPTATETNTPTITPTSTATDTPTSTFTPSLTSTPTPTGIVATVISDSLQVFDAPSASAAILGTLNKDDQVDLYGADPLFQWYLITFQGKQGWIPGSVARVSVFGNVGALPIIASPTPTATASATPTVTYTSTPEATATSTDMPTATITNTRRVTATNTNAPTQVQPVLMLKPDQGGTIRRAPDPVGEVIRDMTRTEKLPAVGYVDLGKGVIWYQVRLPDGTLGWIYGVRVDLIPPDAILPRLTPPPTLKP